MTPESPNGTDPTEQARAYIEKATEHGQPRRYVARRLIDTFGLTQRQVADLLEVSLGTVSSDLAQTVEPLGATTDAGSVIYPLGRFDDDPDFKARVAELDMPEPIARLQAAREFAGPVLRPMKRLRTSEAQAELQQRAIKAAAKL